MAAGTLVDDLNLAGLQNLGEVLARVPGGGDLFALVGRMGFWTKATHDQVEPLRRFPTSYSNLQGPALSDAAAYWQAEKCRVDEVIGVLTAVRERLTVLEKREQAAARSRVLRRLESDAVVAVREGRPVTKPTSSMVADAAMSDPAVEAVSDAASLVAMLLHAASAHREAVTTIVTGMSREVSYRSAMMNARVY